MSFSPFCQSKEGPTHLLPMGAKSKYVIVQLASVITGSTRVWVRDRAADKFSGIFMDPALGRKCLFEEAKRIKGKSELPKRIREMYNITT